ncbi:MAG: hypothetical protein E6Q40_04300 [Cupriavidus sp.]|nr:MAG: hypothetical protein E6Q40_04300 [Cupriavidus sp.]
MWNAIPCHDRVLRERKTSGAPLLHDSIAPCQHRTLGHRPGPRFTESVKPARKHFSARDRRVPDHASERADGLRRPAAVPWAGLLALLGATVGCALLPLGNWNGVLSLAIAAIKAMLVVLCFMRLRGLLLVVVMVAPLIALALMFGLTHADYATRVWVAAPWQVPVPE